MNVLLEMWHAIAMLYVPTQLDPSHASAILVSLEMVKHAEVINTRIMCCVGINNWSIEIRLYYMHALRLNNAYTTECSAGDRKQSLRIAFSQFYRPHRAGERWGCAVRCS